jgi:phytoene synthase
VDVEHAYAEVERLTRERAKNFAWGIMVLPKAKRRAIAAIYAFAREVDDIADGTAEVQEKRMRLDRLRERLDEEPETPMEIALTDARSRFPIPRPALEALVDGGVQDTHQTRYATIDELLDYCRKVAGAVGVACVAVYGSDDVEHAERLGLALQLINIARDVREDWELGRVYLPQDELHAYGVSEDDIASARTTPQWRALMAFQAERARRYLDDGLLLLRTLDRRSAICVGTFAGLYRATLDRIEAAGYDVLTTRPSLSTSRKLAVVARELLR